MKRCRLCGSKTHQFLNLGTIPLPEEFRSSKAQLQPVKKYPLLLNYCKKCLHIQLGYQVEADLIYKHHYFYDYSVTRTGQLHWQNLAKYLHKQYKMTNKSFVVDIGSNTGTLLSYFKKLRVRIHGVDPAAKFARVARMAGIPTEIGYFSPKIARKIICQQSQADIITTTNVFDHVADLHEFMEALKILLKPEGVFVIEVPYFLPMVTNGTHTVYHQQIDYTMLTPFISFFHQYGMNLFDCETLPIHGGSVRMFVSFQKSTQSNRLQKLLQTEKNTLYNHFHTKIRQFSKIFDRQKKDCINFLHKKKSQGDYIAGIGASAKGITFLNYCGIGPETIDYITEKSGFKIGLYTPSGIPVVPDDVLLKRMPDYALILAWNFVPEITKNLKTYSKKGGTFITPIPNLTKV